MLQGNRVRLRPVEREDLDRQHELMNGDVELVMLGHGAWWPRSRALIEHRYKQRLEKDDPADFVIESDGKVVGEIGLHPWTLDRRTATVEFGIGIYDPAYVGQGYGGEALDLLLEWAFRDQNYRRIWLTTLSTNERAIHCYARRGFVEEGRMREHEWFNGTYVDMLVMGLLRSEWESSHAMGRRSE